MKTPSPRTIISTVAAAALGSALAAAIGPLAQADDKGGEKGNDFSARLSGYNEVHFSGGSPLPAPNGTAATLRGAISTGASGSFRMKIDESQSPPIIHYEIAYQDLEGDVRQAHIHFGQRHTTGGITVWLCQTTQNPSPVATTPACPGPRGGTVTGIITQADVIVPTGQGIAAGDIGAVIRAIRAGATYANVHTVLYGPGEIRGQIRKGGGHGHDDKGKK